MTKDRPTEQPSMIDVGAKPDTDRVAVAIGFLRMEPATLAAIREGRTPKGDPTTVARIAGIQAAKRTPDLIPLCHPLTLNAASVDVEIDASLPGLRARAEVHVHGRTGAEMEALTAVAVALLSAYDMLKAIDPAMRMEGVRLIRKEGGKSGVWTADAPD